ncbi:MAG: RluA family pseudouridine synthase [Hyphomonadaceae bacterium]|nr:RluA family pseudouridine synthase [Hyphomonadaceae bacterium]MBC6411798.1 RluA family pseudouridine synthase [Hyphomonadaceae bacterium]
MSGIRTLHIAAGNSGQRLDRWFRQRFPGVPHGRVEKLLRTGQIRVDGRRIKGSHRLRTGEAVRIPPLPDASDTRSAPKTSDTDIAFMQSLIIYDDHDLIALNKPFGLAVQGGSKTHRHIDGLLPALGDGCRLIHRLDRDTTGVLVVAKNAKAAAWAGKAFQSRKAEKIYWAVTNGVPKPLSGEIKGYMAKGKPDNRFGHEHTGREIMQAVRHGTDGARHARTLYQVPQTAGQKAALVIMQPLTGRTHQLRLHMQLLGAPVAADPKYMTDRPLPGGLDKKLHLHAKCLTLPGPCGDLSFEAPLPDHMNRTFATLGFNPNPELLPWEELR